MAFTQAQTSSQKFLQPYSATTSREKLSSATSSREELLDTSSWTDITLQIYTSGISSTKLVGSNKSSSSKPSLASWPGHRRASPKQPPRHIEERTLALSVTIALAILVLIGVPLGAVLPQKYVDPLPINVLVPFYVYPDPKAWNRLFEAAIVHPDTNFTVILSTDHDPSDAAWPISTNINLIKRLNALPNVRTIGYVDTLYGSRDNKTVHKDIATYAGWNNSGIAISGIFFDHTPTEDINGTRAYLTNVSQTVRRAGGFLQPTIVVHNPGRIPEANMTSLNADVTVVFEGGFKNMGKREEMKSKLSELQGRREDYAMIVHSVPRTISRGGVRKIINGARRDCSWLFVTDRLGDKKYDWYSDRWEEFLDLIR